MWTHLIVAVLGATVLAICAFKLAFWLTQDYYMKTEPDSHDGQLGMSVLASAISAFVVVEAFAGISLFWLQRKLVGRFAD
jgi:hypothetical protein